MADYRYSRHELTFHRRTTTRLLVGVLALLVFAVLVYQNAGPVPIKVFLWEFQGNRLVVVAVSFLAGLLTAWIGQRLALRRRRSRDSNKRH